MTAVDPTPRLAYRSAVVRRLATRTNHQLLGGLRVTAAAQSAPRAAPPRRPRSQRLDHGHRARDVANGGLGMIARSLLPRRRRRRPAARPLARRGEVRRVVDDGGLMLPLRVVEVIGFFHLDRFSSVRDDAFSSRGTARGVAAAAADDDGGGAPAPDDLGRRTLARIAAVGGRSGPSLPPAGDDRADLLLPRVVVASSGRNGGGAAPLEGGDRDLHPHARSTTNTTTAGGRRWEFPQKQVNSSHPPPGPAATARLLLRRRPPPPRASYSFLRVVVDVIDIIANIASTR